MALPRIYNETPVVARIPRSGSSASGLFLRQTFQIPFGVESPHPASLASELELVYSNGVGRLDEAGTVRAADRAVTVHERGFDEPYDLVHIKAPGKAFDESALRTLRLGARMGKLLGTPSWHLDDDRWGRRGQYDLAWRQFPLQATVEAGHKRYAATFRGSHLVAATARLAIAYSLQVQNHNAEITAAAQQGAA